MDIQMPQLGETVDEGTVITWYRAVGDHVTAGEDLFEVSTDKVDSDIPSPVDGVLVAIHVNSGETVPVGTVVAVITANGSLETPAEEVDSAAAQSFGSPSRAQTEVPELEPAAQRLSPAVRRLLAKHNMSADDITGTGPGGRIMRTDVLESVEQVGSTSARRTSAGRTDHADELRPFTRIRKATAEHMVRSKATSPHVLSVVEVDYANVDRVRAPASKALRAAEGAGMTYLPFIARAVIDALALYPDMNAWVEGDALRVHRSIHLGIAVDRKEQGLVVPVIREAQDLRLTALRAEINSIASRARANAITADELTGGTITLSNNGSFGATLTAPIINQPQVAVISSDAVRLKPVVVVESGQPAIAIRPVGNLAMSWDHRALDGGYAGAFLAEVGRILETRNWGDELAGLQLDT